MRYKRKLALLTELELVNIGVTGRLSFKQE